MAPQIQRMSAVISVVTARVTGCFCEKIAQRQQKIAPVLWCFLFDFMLISNGTGHSFIVFLHKKGDKIFQIFLRHVKNLFWNIILARIFSWLKFCPNHWAIFSRKNFTQYHKKLPKWLHFAQSGHPGYSFSHFLSRYPITI